MLNFSDKMNELPDELPIPVTKLSEQILTRVHGLADAWLEDKSKWNAFHQQYQDKFHQSEATDYGPIEKSAAYAAGELMADKGWESYLRNSGLHSTAHLFNYLIGEIIDTHILHGCVYTQPGSEEETYLNAYSQTLSEMPMPERTQFAQLLVEQCEQGKALLEAGHNVYEAWTASLSHEVPDSIANAFNENIDNIERDYLEESI